MTELRPLADIKSEYDRYIEACGKTAASDVLVSMMAMKLVMDIKPLLERIAELEQDIEMANYEMLEAGEYE